MIKTRKNPAEKDNNAGGKKNVENAAICLHDSMFFIQQKARNEAVFLVCPDFFDQSDPLRTKMKL